MQIFGFKKVQTKVTFTTLGRNWLKQIIAVLRRGYESCFPLQNGIA